VKLPVYERQIGLPGRANAVRGDAGAAGAGAGQLAEVANRFVGVAAAYGEDMQRQAQRQQEGAQLQQERAASVEAAKIYAQTGVDWTERLLKAQDQAPDGAPEFTKGMISQFDTDAKVKVASAPEQARPWLETRLAALRGQMAEKAMTFEAGARLAKQSRDLFDVVNLHANAVRTDFGRLGDALGTTEGAIEASSLAPAAKVKAREQAREKIAAAALQGLNEQDPGRARQYLAGGGFDAYLTPEQKHKLVNDNYVELRRREAEAEQRRRLAEVEQRARVADMREEARFALQALGDGVAYAGLDDLVKRAERLDPKTAASLQMARGNLSWTSNLLKMDPATIAGELERAQAEAAKADNPALAANLAHRVETGTAVLKRVADQVKKDSLGWAEAQGIVPRTDILGALQAAAAEQDENARGQKIQGAVQARLRAVAATRERYGIDVPFLRPAEADGMVKAFEAAVSPDDKFGVLATLLHLPDEQARRTMAQLEAAKLPTGALHALDVARADPMRIPIARRLVAELTTPAAKVNLTEADLTTIKKEARTNYSDGVGGVLAKAYALTGNVGYEARTQADAAALEHIVKTRTTGGIEDPARSAYGDMFGHLSTVDVDRFAHVVVPAGTDAVKLELGLTYLREIEAPRLLESERPADTMAARQWEKASLQETTRAGTWVNSGSGFVLIRPGSGKPVGGPDGRARVWTLDEILGAADKAKAEKFQRRRQWGEDSPIKG